MIDMASKQFIPAVMKYTKQLADTVIAVKEAGVDAEVQAEALREVSVLLKEAKETLATLKKATEEAAEKEEGEVQATYYHSEVVPAMEALRVPVDKLEMIVDKEAWPMLRMEIDLRGLIHKKYIRPEVLITKRSGFRNGVRFFCCIIKLYKITKILL